MFSMATGVSPMLLKMWVLGARAQDPTCCGSMSLGCSAASSRLAASHSRARRSIARMTSCSITGGLQV